MYFSLRRKRLRSNNRSWFVRVLSWMYPIESTQTINLGDHGKGNHRDIVPRYVCILLRLLFACVSLVKWLENKGFNGKQIDSSPGSGNAKEHSTYFFLSPLQNAAHFLSPSMFPLCSTIISLALSLFLRFLIFVPLSFYRCNPVYPFQVEFRYRPDRSLVN